MHKTILTSLFGLFCLALGAAAQDDAEIQRIQQDVEMIEKSFPEWPTFMFEATGLAGGQGIRYHLARSEEEPNFVCVRIHIANEHGPIEVTNYFKGDDLEYVLHRQETVAMQENAPAVVVESRYYFSQKHLIQAWQKKGSFPTDQVPDMKSIKDKQLELDKVEDADSQYERFSSQAMEAATRLTKVLADDNAPAAKETAGAGAAGHRSGTGWRLIQGTESPLYQELGIGWHAEIEGAFEKDDDGAMFYDYSSGGVDPVNFVVNLKTGEIIGKTNGKHSSDKAHFLQLESTNETVWSGSREFMVQMAQGKHFDTMSAELYYLPEMQSVSAGTDVRAAVQSAIQSKMKGKFNVEETPLGLHDVQVASRGNATVLSVGVSVMLAGGEGPDLTITFKVTTTDKESAPKLTLLNLVTEN